MRLIDADKIQFSEIDEIGGEYEPYLGCSKRQIDNLLTVEAIPETDYENRLKADMAAMLEEIKSEIEESEPLCNECDYAIDDCTSKAKVNNIIQQKINELKEAAEDNEQSEGM